MTTTTMMRFRRVAQLWNWLPGFRGVAEHESVHKAAHALGISPSALSRTVKQLESAIGAPLFVRQGSGLALTTLGGDLLAITRDMMRQVDDCISRDEARRGGAGPLHVGVTSDLAAAVVARALVIGDDRSRTLHVQRVVEDTAEDELLQGNVDLVVLEASTRNPELIADRVGEARFGIYAARDHLLGDQSAIAREALDAAAYVAVTSGPPLARGFQIACYCDSIDVARAICESSTLLCVLPNLAVGPRSALQRLADDGEPVVLHALRRRPLPSAHDDRRLGTLVEGLRAVLA